MLAHARNRRGFLRTAGRAAFLLRGLAHDARRNHHTLHLAGALVNRCNFRVAVHPLHIHALEEARAAENLHRVIGYLKRNFRRVQLCHCRLGAVRLVRFLLFRCRVDQEPRTAQLGRHVGELEADALIEADWLAELDALLGVFDRRFIRALRDAQRLRRNTDAAAVQRCHRDFEALPFLAEQVLLGYLHVVENQFRRRGGTDTHLIVMVAKREALPALFYDKRRNAARADIRCRHRKDNVGIRLGRVGDENLATVEQPIIALVYRGSLGAARVRACVRLGQPKRANLLALAERDKIFLLLLLIAESGNRPRAQRYMGGQNHARAAVHPGQLLHRNRVTQHVKPRAAVFLGVRDPHQAHFAQLLDGFRREQVFLVHQERMGLDLSLNKRADFRTQRLMGFGCLEQHHTNTSFSACS